MEHFANGSHLCKRITDFLNSQAAQSELPGQGCVRCGATMRRLQLQFSLYGSERSWKIGLPLCPCCDLLPAVLDSGLPVAAKPPGAIC